MDFGPCHTPGIAIFKDIHEIKPAHFIIFNKSGIHVEKYWSLKSKEHKDSFGKTCETVKYLLEDSISRQLVSDEKICTMLSGGLDSSIITAYASNYYRSNNMPALDTFSVDYVDNDKNFVKSDFQPNSDNFYIDIMSRKYRNKSSQNYNRYTRVSTGIRKCDDCKGFTRNGRCGFFFALVLQKYK